MTNYEVSIDSVKELWEAGAVKMPTIGDQYAEAAIEVHRSAMSADRAFARSGGNGALYKALTDLRNLFQDKVLVKSSDNCVAAGEALMKIADSFATADYLNAAEIEEYNDNKDEVRNSDSPSERPPEVRDAPGSEDPHPDADQQGEVRD